MSEQELHTLTGAYAVNALEPAEQDAFERHLEACAACRQEVAELRATTARLAVAASTSAPPALRVRVLAEIAGTRQVPPLPEVTSLDDRRITPPWYRQPAVAAAAVLLVAATGLGGLATVESRRAEQAHNLATRIAAVAADPNSARRTVASSTRGTGTIVAGRGLAVFHAAGLPRLPEGRAYQLWRMSGQQAQSAGVLGRGGELSGVVTGMGPGDTVGVTVEPASGSDRPTTAPVLLIRMS
jgi:anti-sigma-K factor RskA